MKKTTITLIMICTFGVVGCNADNIIGKIFRVENTIVDSMDKADPIVAMLENTVPGWKGMDYDKQQSIIKGCDTLKSKGMKVQEIAVAVGKMFPPAAPVTNTIAGIIGLITLGAGAVGRFIENRKTKKVQAEKETLEAGVVAMMNAVDKHEGVGTDIKAATALAGKEPAKAIHALYQANVAK